MKNFEASGGFENTTSPEKDFIKIFENLEPLKSLVAILNNVGGEAAKTIFGKIKKKE